MYQLFYNSVIHKCSVFCEKTNDGRLQSWEEYDLTHQLNPDRRAATAELTPRCSVRPSYCLLRPRSRENLYPAGTSHFPRPWAGHVRRGCLTVDVKRVLQVTGANPAFLHTSPFALLFTGANHGFLPPSLDSRVQIRPFCPRHAIIDVVPHV